jgi:hypothetical protein
MGAGIGGAIGAIGGAIGAIAAIVGAIGAGRGPAAVAGASALPQLRQNFIPGGFSPRQTPQTIAAGNPGAGS